MTHVLRIAHLRIALHVANPEVGKREGIPHTHTQCSPGGVARHIERKVAAALIREPANCSNDLACSELRLRNVYLYIRNVPRQIVPDVL